MQFDLVSATRVFARRALFCVFAALFVFSASSEALGQGAAPDLRGWAISLSAGAEGPLGTIDRAIVKAPNDTYVGAAGGTAFVLNGEADGFGSRKTVLQTSRPVFKAFGLSSDGQWLLYIPLNEGIPGTELLLERLDSGMVRTISSDGAIAAAISPANDDHIAFTYPTTGGRFGLAVVNINTGARKVIASEGVYSEQIGWSDDGRGVHYLAITTVEGSGVVKDGLVYYEPEAEIRNRRLVNRFASYNGSGLEIDGFAPSVPGGFPSLLDRDSSADLYESPVDTRFGFSITDPSSTYRVFGSNLLSGSTVFAEELATGSVTKMGAGRVVGVIASGVVIKTVLPTGSEWEFVGWDGSTVELGGTMVNYNLPVGSSMVTQGGLGYADPGNCLVVSHTEGLRYAYDFQGSVSAHLLSTADGVVVAKEDAVTCNTIDTDCPDYSATGCPGSFFGNYVTIQHADGTYSFYAHLETSSPQVEVGTTVDQGLYIGRQGHTGSTNGTFNSCGDHLHFQRQATPDLLGETVAIDFADVVSDPLSCGSNYNSASTEIDHTISPTSQAFGIPGGMGSVTVTSNGGTWYAVSNDAWITITSPATGNGTGNGTVDFTVADNSAEGNRTGTMVIGGKLFTVTQTGGGVTNVAPTVNAGTDQTINLPSMANLVGTASDDGLPNPPAAFTTAWSKVSGPGTVTFGDGTALSTTATFSMPGVYILRLTANDSALTSADDVRIIVNTSTGTGTINGSQIAQSVPIDLTAEGTQDWVHWGIVNSDDFDQKSGVTNKISDFTVIGSIPVHRFAGNPHPYTWTDGTPTASATTATGVYMYEINNGFELTVDADTTLRRLKLYVGVYRARGRLEVTMSDGSASPFVDTTFENTTNNQSGLYQIDFKSATAGQQMLIRWTVDFPHDPIGNITMEAATLSSVTAGNTAPTVNAGTDQTITLPAMANLVGSASDDGLPAPPGTLTTTWSKVSGPGTVTFGDPNAVSTTATFSLAGVYVLRLTGDDSNLQSTDDVKIIVNASGGTGTLGGSNAAPPADTDLTTEGTSDWTHYGLTSVGDFNQKSTGGSQISNLSMIGSGTFFRYANNANTYSWTDGTPATSASMTPTGIFIAGTGNGFQITAPADTTQRTLKVYAGVFNSTGRLEAYMSDGSASPFIDNSLSVAGSSGNTVYTITYSAATAGQTLTVNWLTEAEFGGGGNVTIQAATLQSTGGPANTAPTANAGTDQTITLPSMANLAGAASDDGLPNPPATLTTTWSKVSGPGTVTFGDPNALSTTATFSLAGIYILRLTADDSALQTTDDVKIVVNTGSGTGSLGGSQGASPASNDLTTEGTSDWTQWAETVASDFNQKSTGGSQISNYTQIGPTAPLRLSGNTVSYDWTDGTPTASGTAIDTGLTVTGLGNGFRLTVPADTTQRTFKLYVSAFEAGGRLEAQLSDGSASPLIDTSLVSNVGTTNAVYTITYQAASAAQTLTLDWTVESLATGGGYVSLQAATLQTAGGPVNTAPTVNAGTDQTITLPSMANLAGSASDDGLPNPPATLTTTWSKVSGPGTVTFGDPNAVSTTATFSLAGIYVLRLTGDDSALQTTDDVKIIVNTGSGTGSLGGSNAAPPANVNLTTEGTSDWTQWAETVVTDFNQKSTGGSQISNYTQIGGTAAQRFFGNSVTYDWTDGNPTIVGTGVDTGLYIGGLGNGFRVTVPADTTQRTLKLYVSTFEAGGRLEASLSDGSASPFVDTSLVSTAGTNAVYTLTYQAASAAQTLTIDWTVESLSETFGNVTLQAATLQIAGPPPNTAPTANAGSDQTITLPSMANLTGSASDDGLPNPPATLTTTWSKVSGPGTVTFGDPNALSTTATFSLAGIYVLRLTADDSDLQTTDDVKIVVNTGSGTGSLGGSNAAPPANVNLTAEGTSDWSQWALANDTDFNQKSGGSPQIGNYTQIGGTAAQRFFGNTVTYDWTDGTPTLSASGVDSGLYIGGLANGFRLTVPADTTQRTLKLYVSTFEAGGRLEASLSDGSASPFVDTSLVSTAGTNAVYTLTYQAASAAQTLTIDWTVESLSQTFGNVTLQAATLQVAGGPVNTAPTVNAGTDQTITLPSMANLTGSASDDGLPNPPATLTTTWSKVSGPGTVTFGDPNALSTTATFSLAGIYVLRLTADDSDLQTTDDVKIVVNTGSGTGSLGGSQGATPASNDLTTEGTSDWTQWAETVASDFNQKSTGGSQISNYTQIGPTAPLRLSGNTVSYDWTDGNPTVVGTGVDTGLTVTGLGNGFRLTVPADTTQRTFKLYVSAFEAGGRLEAQLSDGSASPLIDTSLVSNSGTTNAVYTITYQAASAAQTLTLDWTVESLATGGGYVSIQAATLQSAGGPVNTAPTVNAGTDQTITLPSMANLAGSASDDGLPNPPATLTTTWSKVSGPGTVTFGDPNAVSTTATFSLAGIYVLRLTGDDSALQTTDDVKIIVNTGSGTGTLGGSQAAPAASNDLTAEGTSDWTQWGRTNATELNRKNGVSAQISNFSQIGPVAASWFSGNPVTYDWTDGTPVTSASNVDGAIFISGLGNGFRITVPADTTTKTLKLYVSAFESTGRLEASLSDGSASPYIDTSVTGAPNQSAVYSISFQAGSAAQTLTIDWTVGVDPLSFGNVTIQAATLAATGPVNTAPTVNAGTDQSVTLPAMANLAGTASDDGLPSPPATLTTTWSKVSGPGTVTFGDPNALSTTATFSMAGIYTLRLTGDDSALQTTDDMQVIVNVTGAGGQLGAGSSPHPADVDLTAVGTADWTHYGLAAPTDFNQKSTGGSQISNVSLIGTGPYFNFSNNPNTYTWSDGMPTTSASMSPTGIFVPGVGNGFQFTVPADTTLRQLRVYLGVFRAQGRLEAFLSDGSASPVISTSLSNNSTAENAVYTINFAAASAGQTLTVNWFTDQSFDPFGNVTLQAAALVDVSTSALSGTVSYGSGTGNQGVPGVTMTAAGTPALVTQTDSAGGYVLTGFGAGAYDVTPTKSGDVNGIDLFDASLVARHSIGLITLNANEQIAADASDDANVDFFDASLIARTALAIPNPGIAGTWKFSPTTNNYPGPIAALTGENYSAMLVGEVSGNWTPPAPFVGIPPNPNSKEGGKVITTKPITLDELLAGITVSFPPSQIVAGTNTTILIPISVGDTTGQGIFSFQGTITFDQSVMTPNATPLDVAGTVSSGFSPFANATTPGQLVFGAFGVAELTGSGTLINLRFDTMSTHLATTNLTFTGFQFNSGTPVSKTTNGSLILFSPTGARVTVGGRVTDGRGRGLKDAFVRITTPSGDTRAVRTNNFGYYRIQDVEAGDSYLFTVSRKGSTFTPSSTIRTIDGETLDINFRSDK